MPTYTLTVQSGRYAVCRLAPSSPVPAWASGGDFCTITRTGEELSIICTQDSVPIDLPDMIRVVRDWVLLRVEGSFAFDVTGVLAALATPLAQAGIVLLAVSTYQTDYLLVKAEQIMEARMALTNAGHIIII